MIIFLIIIKEEKPETKTTYYLTKIVELKKLATRWST